MSTYRGWERIFFECPEVSGEDYLTFPSVSDEEFYTMGLDFYSYSSVIHIFPFVSRTESANPYVELYIWDLMQYPDVYKRFVIFDGQRMNEEDEEKFLSYAKCKLYIYPKLLEQFSKEVQSIFPQWHLQHYKPNQIGRMMEHIYFASHPSGPRETLYKAELENIAYHLDKLPGYNIFGSTPEKIIGKDLPLKLLRILNQWEFTEFLFEVREIDLVREVYRKYSGYLGKNVVTAGQWKYLEELSKPNGLFKGMKFNRTIYENLCEEDSEDLVEGYRQFLDFRLEFSEIKKMKIPHSEDLYDIIDKLEQIKEYRKENSDIDRLFKLRKEKTEYEYRGHEYSVVMPNSPFDICLEAISQHSCVIDYIEEHAIGYTTILFIRKNNSIDKSFVTMSINKMGCIEEVLGKFNRPPYIDIFFFLGEYARKVWLYYDPYALVKRYIKEINEHTCDKKLLEYIEDYRKRHAWPIFQCEAKDIEYVQLSIADLYPDFWGV